jgi:zinc transporter 9
MAGSNRGAVFFALLGSAFLAIIKFVAFFLSGSGAILSEAIHSLADTGNQALLYAGIRRSQRPADSRYHYGYGADRYLYALLAAVGIFVLGFGVTTYHGVQLLLDPHEIELSWLSFAVMGVAIVLEAAVLIKAVREVNAKRGRKSFMEFIRSSTDPTLLAVLFEDSVAIVGALVASAGILLAYVTGNPIYDAITSVIIGVILGFIALWLAYRNRQLLLGPAIPPELQAEVVGFLEAQPSVQHVRMVRTRIAAADRFTIAAELDYDGRYLGRLQADWIANHRFDLDDPGERERFAAEFGEMLIDELGKEVDRIEAGLRERFPRLRDVALESDWNPED